MKLDDLAEENLACPWCIKEPVKFTGNLIVTTFSYAVHSRHLFCINKILFLFPYFKCYFCTSDATSGHTQSLQSVVTESGMAEEVKVVNDSIVQKVDKKMLIH